MKILPYWLRTLPERALISLICAAIIFLVIGTWKTLTRDTYTAERQTEFFAALRETSHELEKFDEIEAVYFSSIEVTKDITVKLRIRRPVSEKFSSTIEDETRRIFFHALIDCSKNPNDAAKIFSNTKITVEFLP